MSSWEKVEEYSIRGIDISHWNHPIDYASISENIDFVFLKITEGKTFTDRLFELHYQQFSETNLAIGAYHFFNFGVNGLEQARHFTNSISGRRLQLPLVVDVEQTGNPVVPDYLVIDELNAFNNKMIELTGYRPMIYTNGDGFNRFIKNDFEDHLIWLAGNNIDRVNAINPTFWQFNQQGKIYGSKGDIDLNVFRGKIEDWQKLISEYSRIN